MTGQGIGSTEFLPEPTLLDIVTDLRRDVAGLTFELDIPGVDEARDSAARLLTQLDDHLLPRLRELSTPAVVVIAGSTGAGKSTLLNSLLGAEISPASVIRPTTRQPVLVTNPADAELISASSLLDSVRTETHDDVPRGLALLDAPDLDSLLASNRETASRMLDAGDLWLFVTTAARYGDALPWQALRRAQERGASVALVLNRVSRASLGPVRSDLLARLKEHDMAGVPLFIVEDAGPHEGLLEASAVAPIIRWLRTLAGADHARTVILRTLRGSLTALDPWIDKLSAAADQQREAVEALNEHLAALELQGLDQFASVLESDGFASGVLDARWQQITGSDPGLSRVSTARWRRPSKKSAAKRGALLSGVIPDVRAVVSAQLETALSADATAVADSLTGSAVSPGPAGGGDLQERIASEQQDNLPGAITEAARGWIAHARGTLAELRTMTATREMFERAERSVTEEGLTSLVLLATMGVGGAARVLDSLVGAAGRELVTQLRADLLERAHGALDAGRAPYVEWLSARQMSDDAALGLRLRLAELRRTR